MPPLVVLLLLAALAGLAGPAAAADPAPFFRSGGTLQALPLGPQVLTPQERAFVSALPELRVAIPLPAARPYEVVAANGEVSGIHPEMLSYLARAFGLRVRPVLLPGWPAALEAMQRREADLIMSIGYTAERARYLEFTLGVTPLPGALFSRRSGAAASDAQLAGARFAIERDFLAADYVRRQYPRATILAVEDTGQALREVAAGRADYYLGSLLAAIDWLAREPVPGVEVNRLLNYGGGHYHFAVRKDWAPLVGVLNKGISTLRAQGLSPALAQPAWSAAASALPPGTPLELPLKLDEAELALLIRHPVWRVGAVRDLPLLNHLEADGRHSGIAAEVTEQVVRRLGVGQQVVGFDTVGAMMDGLRRGEIDLIPFLTRTPEREREFAFSQPYAEMPYVIVARTDAPLYWNLDSLRGRTLALATQHPLRPLLASRYPDIRLLDVPDARGAMDAVADRRADAAVEVKLFANLRINGDGDGRLRTVATVEEVPAQFHFATLQAGAPLLALVDRALRDIPEDERQRMRRRWVAVDLDPPFPWRRWLPQIVTVALALLVLGAATAWWLRRLSREVDSRRRTEEQLRDIAASIPCVAFRHVFDASGRQLLGGWVSSRSQALLGLPGSEDVPAGRAPREQGQQPGPGQTVLSRLAERLPAAEAEAVREAERQALAAGTPLRRTLAYPHPDGSTRWLSVEAVRTPAGKGLQAWTGYIVDASQEQALQRQLVDSAQNRNLMLASASHELRAPAHTLALALQALPAEGLAPPQVRALRIARDAVDTLSQLLGDVLDAARFDGAPLRLRPRDFDLRELLHKVAEGAAANAASKGLAFTLTVDPLLPARVRMDSLRLRQVMVNLLSNAFKYTREGAVELAVRRHAGTSGRPDELAVTVADTGPGIAPALQARLFTPFAAAQGSAAAAGEGSSGLGLPISRQLAERLGGRLELDSRPGQGTRATLVLPLLEATAPPPAPLQRRGAVLVCDDDLTSRLLLTHVLAARGYAVEEAELAEAALVRCRQGGIAALITDLEMPGLGGLGLLRTLREELDDTQRPALVVCSGDSAELAGSIDTRELADARLVKPVDLQALLQTLAALGVHPEPDLPKLAGAREARIGEHR